MSYETDEISGKYGHDDTVGPILEPLPGSTNPTLFC